MQTNSESLTALKFTKLSEFLTLFQKYLYIFCIMQKWCMSPAFFTPDYYNFFQDSFLTDINCITIRRSFNLVVYLSLKFKMNCNKVVTRRRNVFWITTLRREKTASSHIKHHSAILGLHCYLQQLFAVINQMVVQKEVDLGCDGVFATTCILLR